VPAEWGSFKIHYRYKSSVYEIHFTQDAGVGEMSVKEGDIELTDKKINLEDDGRKREIRIVLYRGKA
jgi:cellobiose phosphorylase